MTNGEKYKTAKERADALASYCESEKCKRIDDCVICQFAWLDLEAEEEKPLPCPFCGNICRTQEVANEYFTVVCNDHLCVYRSRKYSSTDKAIVAHNSVTRAVMAAKKKEAK